jgi:hypothetical protein
VVHGGGGLAVGRGGDHPPVARGAQHVRVEEVDAVHPAGPPLAERRRLQGGVRAQHVFQQAGVGELEGRDVAVEECARPLVGGVEQVLGRRAQFGQPGAGALQSALHRGPRGAEDLRGLSGGERQHLAQDEDRALAGGQVLQARDECQPHRLARHHRRERVVLFDPAGGGDPAVRQRFQPRDLARAGGARRLVGAVVGTGQARGQHPPPARLQRVQADVGGDPVEPRPDRRAALEAGVGAPRPQVGLLHRVLGVVRGAEHPVAVRHQLPAEPLGLSREPVLVRRCRRGSRARHALPPARIGPADRYRPRHDRNAIAEESNSSSGP